MPKTVRDKKLSNYQLTREIFYNEVVKRADEKNITLPVKLGNSKRSSQSEFSNEDLTTLYEKTDHEYRKKNGQFFTSKEIAKFMISYGLAKKDTKIVMDPACGTGVFFKALIDMGYDEKIIGIDKDPLMIDSCYVDLRTMYDVNMNNLKIYVADYLLNDCDTEKVDFLVCNPPYVNFHDFDRNLISKIEQDFGIKIGNLTNLYVLFMIKAMRSVKTGGRIAFITPSEFFYTGYGIKLKQFMLENFTIDNFITFNFDKTVFDKVATTSTISLLVNKKANKNHKVKFIKTNKLFPGIEKTKISATQNGTYANIIKQTDLDPYRKWQNYFSDMETSDIVKKLIPLSEIADIKRGIATGSNRFFTLTSKEKRKWDIEDHFLVDVISKATQTTGYEITKNTLSKLSKNDEKIHLLYCDGSPSTNLLEYIHYGMKIGIDKKYLCMHRKPWYSMEKRKPAPILATVFSRDNMRFIHNKTKCLNLAAYHGIYPRFKDKTVLRALLCYLNSDLCMMVQKQTRREYGNGLHKFEPGDLSELPVMPVAHMSRNDLEEIASLFQTTVKEQKQTKTANKTIHEIISAV